MTFTCDRCNGDYEARKGTAVAHVYVKDSRCNHIEAQCAHCGTTEIIFLGPSRLEDVIREGEVPPTIHAEAESELRVRAEKAWAAAERAMATGGDSPAPAAQPLPEEPQVAPTAVTTYDLTPRHEELLTSFGSVLSNIPDELLWDSLQSDRGHEFPERWTD